MSLLQRWREWRTSRSEYRAAVDEMRFHIEQETEYNLQRGMDPDAARREAVKAFGGIDRYAEQALDDAAGVVPRGFAVSYLDWKLGARMLVKYPGLSLIGGITLASAIGLGAGWFEMTLLTLYPELPLEEGDRIVRVEYWDAGALRPTTGSLHDFAVWREQLASLEQVGAYRSLERNLITSDGGTVPVQVAEISPVAFPLTRVSPVLGRTLTDADAQPGAPDVVVIGHSIWQRRFGGAADVLGRTVQLGRSTATVVGVMPETFGFPRNHRVWIPLRTPQVVTPGAGVELGVFGRLRGGVTLASAQAELGALGERLAAANPATHAQLRPRVLPFAAPSSGGAAREALLINLGALFLLGAAAANVATLMFARTAMRESEIVVRNALGASRLRIMGQLFTEALVLTCTAAVVGLGAMSLVVSYVMRQYAERLAAPFWYEDNIEPVTVLYAALLAVIGAALVGILPAVRATGRHVQAGLTRMASGGTSMRFGGVWSVMIVLQVAFSVLCLPFGLAALLDATRDYRARATFPADAFLTFRPQLDDDDSLVASPDTAAAAAARMRLGGALDELTRRLRQESGVMHVTAVAALPGTYHGLRRMEVQRGTEPPTAMETNIDGNRTRIATVGIDFFETFSMPLVAGRAFHAGDIDAPDSVVIVNEAFARSLGGNPLGVRVRFAAGSDGTEPGPWHEVVGVVRSLGINRGSRGEEDFMFRPAALADVPYVVVRVNGDAAEFAPRLLALGTQVDPGLRLKAVMSLREAIRLYDLPTVQMTLIGVGVVLLAIILSAASLFALMSVAVTRRTREIAIRLAIGAHPREVLSALFARAATQIGIGIVIGNALVGLVLSLSVSDVQLRYVIPPMLLASAVMALVGVAACFVPGRRALRVAPTQALKQAQ